MRKELYVIKSGLTGRPFVSPGGDCAAFESRERAKEFTERYEGTAIDISEDDINMIKASCYAAGGSVLRIIGDCPESEELDKSTVMAGYYNNYLNRQIARYKHGDKEERKEAFYNLAQCRFLIPVKISGEDKTRISFGILKSTDSEDEGRKIYLAFSGLDFFELWSQENTDGLYQPVEVDFDGLKNTCGSAGFIIDIEIANIIIGQKLIKKLTGSKPQTELHKNEV